MLERNEELNNTFRVKLKIKLHIYLAVVWVTHNAQVWLCVCVCVQTFRQLFEEGLELQKVRLREQRAYAREQRLEHQRRHQDQIKSMENYYKDQFSLLAEKLAQEREDIQVRKRAQEKVISLLTTAVN